MNVIKMYVTPAAPKEIPAFKFFPSKGKIVVEILHGALPSCSGAGYAIAGTKTFLRCGRIPEHELRRIREIIAATSATHAAYWRDGAWTYFS